MIRFMLDPPPCELSPNKTSHRHWRDRHSATDTYRTACQVYCMLALPRGYKPAPCRIEVEYCVGKKATQGCYRPRDVQNALASLKAAFDGFVLAGLVPDDSAVWITEITTRIVREESSGVRITVHPVEGE